MIGSWIADNDQSWLLELFGVLIGKGTWGPFSTKVVGTGVGSELKDSSLSELSISNDQNIFWVVDSGNNSSSNHEFLPSLGNVQIVNTFLISSVNVWLHDFGAVLSTNVDSGGKHKSKIFLSGL
jgi:hypothetical protein